MKKITQLMEAVKEVKHEKRGRPIRLQTIAETTMIKLLATPMKWNISQTHKASYRHKMLHLQEDLLSAFKPHPLKKDASN